MHVSQKYDQTVLPAEGKNTSKASDLGVVVMLDALPQMASLWRHDGTLVQANSSWRAFWAMRVETWIDAVHPEDRPSLDDRMHGAGSLGTVDADCRLPDLQGNWTWFSISIRPITIAEDKSQNLVSAFPIGVFKQREALLQGSHDLLTRMLDASDDCIKVLSPSGYLKHMNRAGCAALGVREGSGFGMEWLPLLPAEVHGPGAKALACAQHGQPGRFPGMSQLPDQMPHYWDNLLTPLLDGEGTISDIVCISRDVTAERLREKELLDAKQALQQAGEELREALDAKGVLAGEMLHRIKNLFSVVTGLISMAKRDVALDEGTSQVLSNVKQRIFAMARATEMLMQQTGEVSGRGSFDPVVVSQAVLQPYEGHFTVRGGASEFPHHFLTPLVLLIHELATNSLKHGALSADTGQIELIWAATAVGNAFHWTETGGPKILSNPGGRGFGSKMLQNVMTMSGWRLELDWQDAGLRAYVEMPSN